MMAPRSQADTFDWASREDLFPNWTRLISELFTPMDSLVSHRVLYSLLKIIKCLIFVVQDF